MTSVGGHAKEQTVSCSDLLQRIYFYFYFSLPAYSVKIVQFQVLQDLILNVSSCEAIVLEIVEGIFGSLPPLLQKVEIWVSMASVTNVSDDNMRLFTMMDKYLGRVRDICIQVELDPGYQESMVDDEATFVWEEFVQWLMNTPLLQLSQRSKKDHNLRILLDNDGLYPYPDKGVVYENNILDSWWPAYIPPRDYSE